MFFLFRTRWPEVTSSGILLIRAHPPYRSSALGRVVAISDFCRSGVQIPRSGVLVPCSPPHVTCPHHTRRVEAPNTSPKSRTSPETSCSLISAAGLPLNEFIQAAALSRPVLILRRMQPPRARAERNVAPLRVVIERRHAVPHTRAAVHALLAVEERDAVRTGRY